MGQYTKLLLYVTLAMMLSLAGCGGKQRIASQQSTSAPNTSAKAASVTPSAQRLIAREAGIALSAGGYTLSWKYENPGDYSQDGMVALEDLAQLTEHFNEAATPANEWIDGSGDGTIGVADITPVAMNWGSEVTGYRIDGAESADGPWNEVAFMTLDEGDDTNGRLAFTNEITPGFIYYRIVTLAPDGDAAYSDTLIAPSNEPIIYSVTPISGYQHEEYTFTATASGQEPLTYVWDFGGGATPNTSSDISPTVTLSDAGEYSATLTISNSYGPTTFPFTLTVSARDMWVHTWGGNELDVAADMTVDGEGNLYAVGITNSFGLGGDVLILKFSSSGELIWERTWGTETTESVTGCAVIGNVLVIVGDTYVSDARKYDILVIKYSLEGELVFQESWGTEDYEKALCVTFDDAGSFVVAGRKYAYGSYIEKALITKFLQDGSCIWSRTWTCDGSERVASIALLQDKSLILAGYLSDTAPGWNDALFARLDSNGETLWGKRWNSSLSEYAGSLAISPEGRIYAGGERGNPDTQEYHSLLFQLDEQGLINKSLVVPAAGQICLGQNGSIYGTVLQAGQTGWQPLLFLYDPDCQVLWGKKWESENSILTTLTANTNGDLYLAGGALTHSGEWMSFQGVSEAIEGVSTAIDSSSESFNGSFEPIIGTESSTTGVLDMGGGNYDMLLMKNIPGL